MAERVLDIHALSPLLWRDGRPFAGAEGSETTARSLPLPLPSTIAGFVRTQIGRKQGAKWEDHSFLQNLHNIQICSPLLARSCEIVLPAPRDTVVYKAGEEAKVMRLKPKELTSGAGCNLPEGLQPLEVTADFKPESGYSLWGQANMTNWLLGKAVIPEKIEPLLLDTRVHVAMDSEKGKGKDGQLYSVAYRTLETLQDGRHHQWSIRARVSLPDWAGLESVGLLGGESRPAAIALKDGLSQHWFDCPNEIKTAFDGLRVGDLVRLVLATPALFEQGWRPGWLDKCGEQHLPRGLGKVKLKLVSAAIGRREAVSGWNLRGNQPKAVRWMVPAGSVYFFKILEGNPSDLLESWLRPVSDLEQDRKDGFGLALWGVC
ncbi:MAG: type III-B CRISPR module-associated protein Cmr3 [Thermaceae bacterium]|nr:type III-B CRISPR module-associated protein Cmr3 [Thermaceae bacterium]